jgi:RHH-type transcriptional regulator, proline utilization regulon repressor / proline dehydrogenase / delta 1-pyrroline-5-carboxylate dehydrogenase
MTHAPRPLPTQDIHRLSALYVAPEPALVTTLIGQAALTVDQSAAIEALAADWVTRVRATTSRMGMVDAFLQEYGLSTSEGIILMRLSEALIRTPDFATAQALMRDKLIAGDWDEHTAASPTGLVNAATAGLRLSSAWIMATGGKGAAELVAKLGDRVLHSAVVRGMGIMARHFVLGSTIEDAVARASQQGGKHALCSFDMLGEGAITAKDADRYFNAYAHAMTYLARHVGVGARVATAHGLSVKLSALYPRYEFAKRAVCVPILIEKVRALAQIAKQAGIGLSIDAEEVDRLEMSLQIFQGLLHDPELKDWDGLGIVIQAYQRRATAVIDFVIEAAKQAGRRIAVRLVKGAYWDGEIKRAQEMGLESYPVFTRKEHTDISYLACARKLLSAGTTIFPQFATHNAHTAAAILAMAGDKRDFEFQRLHGMGEALHAEIAAHSGVKSRVYAPVGSHKDLLPYLVRRLLENGANSSFVNQLMNPDIEVDEIVANPIETAQGHGVTAHPAIHAPRNLFGSARLAAKGLDLTQGEIAASIDALSPPASYQAHALINGQAIDGPRQTIPNPARITQIVGEATSAEVAHINDAIRSAKTANWPKRFSAHERAACLNKAADLLEARMPHFLALCVAEAGKTYPDAVAEVREAVDFCRYYAAQATAPAMATRQPLGIVVCISPWNFPLAIFLGQVAAALVAGNCVIAKPAPQTPLIAHAAIQLLFEAGVPSDALHLIIGGGDIGAALVSQREIDGVCFTGSTATARRIAMARAQIGRADSVLIAETGGINAMIVDSTALLEQAVGDVVASAFQSAGQRCSACRIVCVQDDVAEDFERLLAGSLELLQLGDPADLTTDIGPIIDTAAADRIKAYIDGARTRHLVIGEARGHDGLKDGHFVRPIALRVAHLSDVSDEIFGPVLHVVHFKAREIMELVEAINASGFGLTLGLHTRIDARIKAIARSAHVGNIYVNRNQIGAVVGVQPFGGEGLSGTGPKAGGPHYLLRLSQGMAQDLPNGVPNSEGALTQINALAQQLGDPDFVSGGDGSAIAGLACTQKLPGPTGEDNSLTLVPRGRLLCWGGDGQSALIRQILLVFASGNVALIPRGRLPDALLKVILTAGLPANRSEILDAKDLLSALTGPLDGVVADGGARADVASALALRDGPILPLLSAQGDFWRFFHERTVTIDTTAAGGNASLLAMQAEG